MLSVSAVRRPLSVQASFKPLGFTVAVAQDRAIESLMQVGDRFVLNCLPESGCDGLSGAGPVALPGASPRPLEPQPSIFAAGTTRS